MLSIFVDDLMTYGYVCVLEDSSMNDMVRFGNES